MNHDQHTIQETFVEVGNNHQLYVQEWGNPKGQPMVFLHGGPGNRVKDSHRANFDPARHRVIFFDQRGCGKSLPYGSLEHNTTADLIHDITKIADHLHIKKFIIVGPSWGSGLALAYAIKHQERVQALVLQGIFTASQAELDWLLKGEFRTFFPEVWQTYLDNTPAQHHHNPSAYHLKTILGGDEQAAQQSGLAMGNMEAALMSLDDRYKPQDPTTFELAPTKIFAHYLTNACFMPDRYILDQAHKLHIPVWLVQGRYDMDCPPVTAHQLHAQLPNSTLLWTMANHRSGERETSSVMRALLLQFGAEQHA